MAIINYQSPSFPIFLLLFYCSACWNLKPVQAFSRLFQHPKTNLLVPPPVQDYLLRARGGGEDNGNDSLTNGTLQRSFDEIVLSRTACKRFQRYQNSDTNNDTDNDTSTPSISNPKVVQQAHQCLQLAQHAPSSFNTQPYKVVLVHSQAQKQKLAKFALGPNKQRVLDADCTAVFCADRQVLRTLPKWLQWINAQDLQRRNQPTPKTIQLQNSLYITLFSSGYPLPRLLAAPLSFLLRTMLSLVGCFTRWLNIYVLPSFSSAETWATKQCLLTVMTYLLACSSRGLDTAPMEGINAAGIRRVLKIPRRYSIPVIVATGKKAGAFKLEDRNATTTTATPRYPPNDMIFDNQFGANDNDQTP